MPSETRRPSSGTWFLSGQPVGPALRVLLFALAALLLFLAHRTVAHGGPLAEPESAVKITPDR
jgi:hypothetical protein